MSRPPKPRWSVSAALAATCACGCGMPKDSHTDPRDGSIRHALVARVRRQIEAGTYDNPEKWEEALDRLADRLVADE